MNRGLKYFDPAYAALDGIQTLYIQCFLFYLLGGLGAVVGLLPGAINRFYENHYYAFSDLLTEFMGDVFSAIVCYPVIFVLGLSTLPGIFLLFLIPILFCGMVFKDWSFAHGFFLIMPFQALAMSLRSAYIPGIYMISGFTALMLGLYILYLIRMHRIDKTPLPEKFL